jgi:formate C-acetyltransferase
VHIGAKTLATADGRKKGEPLSKNLCASVGMDKKGITALINSVTAFDHSLFPTGSVLDVVLHPSTVSGENGLNAFYGILKTYFARGGFAMHGNVFDSKMLKEAQAHPENYKNLQVRVCGWNAYFVSLTKAEQDAFIKQAENNE